MKKKLAFIGIVSCILALLLGATTVSANGTEGRIIHVIAGESVDVAMRPGDSPVPVKIIIENQSSGLHSQITIIPGTPPAG